MKIKLFCVVFLFLMVSCSTDDRSNDTVNKENLDVNLDSAPETVSDTDEILNEKQVSSDMQEETSMEETDSPIPRKETLVKDEDDETQLDVEEDICIDLVDDAQSDVDYAEDKLAAEKAKLANLESKDSDEDSIDEQRYDVEVWENKRDRFKSVLDDVMARCE
jgi:hypothetical protein